MYNNPIKQSRDFLRVQEEHHRKENKNENNENLDPFGSPGSYPVAVRGQCLGLHHGICGLQPDS